MYSIKSAHRTENYKNTADLIQITHLESLLASKAINIYYYYSPITQFLPYVAHSKIKIAPKTVIFQWAITFFNYVYIHLTQRLLCILSLQDPLAFS